MEIQTANKLYKLKELTNIYIKEYIISLIYSNLNVSTFKYQLIDDNTSLSMFSNDTYYLTQHIMGINCWIIFYEYESKRYQCIINKKDLKYNQSQIDIANLKIYTFWFNQKTLSNINTIYPLTILDGKFIVNTASSNILTYLISDIYIRGGTICLTENIIDKLKMFNNVLQTSIIPAMSSDFEIKIIDIFKINQIGDLIFNNIKSNKLKINGLVFLPIKSGKTYIYINDLEFSNLRNNYTLSSIDIAIQQCLHLSVPAIPINMSVEQQLDTQLSNNFILKKTNISDVYELYKLIDPTTLYLNIKKTNKIGIACVLDIKTSHLLKHYSNENDIFIHKCIFNEKFNKWMPIS